MAYQIMFYGGMVGAGITLLLAVFLFIRLKIWIVIKDLMGYSSAVKRRSPSKSKETGGLSTRKWTTSRLLPKRQRGKEQAAATTEMLETEAGIAETALLEQDLEVEQTVLLDDEVEETTLLTSELEETTLLDELDSSEELDKDFFIQKEEVIIVHSHKTIS
ncbi:hypothetical protein ACERII_21760 [Evansella sp. AB-rgal1]|uniref:hypothetical protein n=1 Tax=Evansella sp. AB-rgal1 TaxID=3242696 RepID=UPI00359D06CC